METLRQNPTRILLESFFDRIDVTDRAENPTRVREGDVCVCYDSSNAHYVHSAFMKRVGDSLLAVSKFGEGPILITTLGLIGRFFAERFDEWQWYRMKSRVSQPELT